MQRMNTEHQTVFPQLAKMSILCYENVNKYVEGQTAFSFCMEMRPLYMLYFTLFDHKC